MSIDEMLPAASQGAIGVECRADDTDLRDLLDAIDHKQTRAAVGAERALLAALTADCHSPVGAHARFCRGVLVLTAELLSGDGTLHVRDRLTVDSAADPETLARLLLDAAPPELRALFGT